MQTVFTNDMVAHVWAQCNQPYGRSANGNFYFDANILYSYGSHFAVGVVKNGCAFLNSDTYSISTKKHQIAAYQAVHHLVVVNVPGLTEIAKYLAAPTFNRETVRREVKAHLIQHAPTMTRGDIDLVLRHINQEKSANSIIRKAEILKRKKAKQARKRHIAKLHASFIRCIKTKGFDAPHAMSSAKNMHEFDNATLAAIRYIKLVKVSPMRQKHIRAIRKAVLTEIKKRDAFGLRLHQNSDIRRGINQARSKTILSGWQAARIKTTIDIATARWPSMATPAIKRLLKQFGVVHAQIIADEKREREILAAKRFEAEKQKRTDWLTGASVGYIHLADKLGGALLRVKDDRLETSQGANVPLDHAVKAFSTIKKMRKHGLTWERNGSNIRVGHFQIDKISADGSIRAGCHLINWPEIERISIELGI